MMSLVGCVTDGYFSRRLHRRGKVFSCQNIAYIVYKRIFISLLVSTTARDVVFPVAYICLSIEATLRENRHNSRHETESHWQNRLAWYEPACESHSDTSHLSNLFVVDLWRCRHVITGDVNNDGHDDVIISAPGFSSPGNYQQGRVYIIYGLSVKILLAFVVRELHIK